MLDDLLGRLHAILGAKFLDLFNGADLELVREEWARALADFKPIELSRGLDEVAKRKFPPTLGEFAVLCRPSLDAEWAFREAEKALRQRDQGRVGEWSHPAVWRAASTLSLEVRRGDWGAVRTRWTFELRSELAKGWGEMPPEPPLKLSDNSRTSGASAIAMRERDKLRTMFDDLRGADEKAA